MTVGRNIKLPYELIKLGQLYLSLNSEDTKIDTLAAEGLERLLIDSPQFRNFMDQIESRSPQIYSDMAGDYWDKIKKEKG